MARLYVFFLLKWEHEVVAEHQDPLPGSEAFVFVKRVEATAILAPLREQADGTFCIVPNLPFVVLETPIIKICTASRTTQLLRIWTERLRATKYAYSSSFILGRVDARVEAVDERVWPRPDHVTPSVAVPDPCPDSERTSVMRRFCDLARGRFDAEVLKQHRGEWGGCTAFGDDPPDDDDRAVELMEKDLALGSTMQRRCRQHGKLRRTRKRVKMSTARSVVSRKLVHRKKRRSGRSGAAEEAEDELPAPEAQKAAACGTNQKVQDDDPPRHDKCANEVVIEGRTFTQLFSGGVLIGLCLKCSHNHVDAEFPAAKSCRYDMTFGSDLSYDVVARALLAWDAEGVSFSGVRERSQHKAAARAIRHRAVAG